MAYVTLFTAVAAIVAPPSFSFVLKESSPEFRPGPADFRAVRHVVERVRDFSACAPGSRLKLGGKVLNKRNLALTALDAVSLKFAIIYLFILLIYLFD